MTYILVRLKTPSGDEFAVDQGLRNEFFADEYELANVTDLLSEPYAKLSPAAAKLLIERVK